MAIFPPMQLEARPAISGTTVKQGLSLLESIADLERRHDQAMDMLGTILATLNVQDNRKRLAAGDGAAGRAFLEIADVWTKQFQMMNSSIFEVRMAPAEMTE